MNKPDKATRGQGTDGQFWSYAECKRMPELIVQLIQTDPGAHQIARTIGSLHFHERDRGQFAVLVLWLFLSVDDQAVRLRAKLDEMVRKLRQLESSSATMADPREPEEAR